MQGNKGTSDIENSQSPMVSGDPETAKLLIVAMSPGEDEMDQGLPLVGPTGHMLWTWLGKAGIYRPQCYCVNTIGEMPEGSGGKVITPEQFGKYWEVFNRLVKLYKGEVAVVLGKDALWRFTGLSGGIESWRGYVVEPTDVPDFVEYKQTIWGVYKSGPKKGQPKKTFQKVADGVPAKALPNLKVIIPTLHPAGIMKQGNTTLPALALDLNRASRATKNPIQFLNNLKPLSNHLNVLSPDIKTAVAFDVEGYDHITHISLADQDGRAVSYNWNSGSELVTKNALTYSGAGIYRVAHNAPFDLEKLRQEDIEVLGPVVDTMLMAVMVQPDMPKGLKYVAPMYIDCKRWDVLQESDILKYNCIDSAHTIELFHILKNTLEERNQWDLFMNTIMPCVPVFMRMSNIGLYINNKRRAEWVEQLTLKLSKLSYKWHNFGTGVEWSKPIQLKKYLKSLGLETKYNKYGGETLDENAIRTHILEHSEHKDILETLLDLREVKKDISTYANVHMDADFTVHPSYLPATKDDDRYDQDGDRAGKGLAGTLRPTAKNPNIQNQTKEARKIFVPRLPGHVFVEMDYKSFEARILAWLAGDWELLKALDDDLHDINSKKLGVDRTRAKNGFYGWSYGAGAPTLRKAFLSKGYHVTVTECKKLLDGFDAAYPKSARYRNSIVAAAGASKVVTNPFGFKRYFYAKNPGMAPANTMIQSTAALIMWKILPELEKEAARQGGFMVAMVHDSVEFELPEGFDRMAFKRIMEREFPEIAEGYFCPIDIKVGPSWGEVA